MSNVLRFRRRRHRRRGPRPDRLLLSYAAAVVLAVLVGEALAYTADYFFPGRLGTSANPVPGQH
jgi:hypothetical protein